MCPGRDAAALYILDSTLELFWFIKILRRADFNIIF